MCDGFFVRAGVRPDDAAGLRRACISLSLALHAGMDYFVRMPVTELVETMKEVGRIGKEKQRVRNGDKNRR